MGWLFGNKKEEKKRKEYLDEVFLLYEVGYVLCFKVCTRRELIGRICRNRDAEYRFILKQYRNVAVYDEKTDERNIEKQVQPQVYYDGYDINDCLDVMWSSYDGTTWEVSRIHVLGGSWESFMIERYRLEGWDLYK